MNDTIEQFGHIDILVNNASVTSGKQLLDIDEEAFMGVLFLASDESSAMCGAELVIDCGHTII